MSPEHAERINAFIRDAIEHAEIGLSRLRSFDPESYAADQAFRAWDELNTAAHLVEDVRIQLRHIDGGSGHG